MILATILIYFCILLIFSKITSHKANNETFYRGNRRSPWYMVAFGMVGASISGITFVSVPGMAYKMNMTYLQMCIGFIFGYFIVAFFLLPVYYKHNLTTIYSYLKDRMGNHSYKTGALILIIYYTIKCLDFTPMEAYHAICDSKYSQIFVFDDWISRQNFWKQFLSGIFVVIVMTGLDQDMMQKNLTCKTLRDAQKDMCTYGFAFVPANLLFLALGILLILLAQKQQMPFPESPDDLLPMFAASGYMGNIVVVFFTIGIVAASFSSADSAITAITTSICVDIIDSPKDEKLRKYTHLGVAILFIIFIILFKQINSTSVIDAIYIICSYTYGPLLGIFGFGIFTKRRANDQVTPYIAILSPIICYAIDWYSSHHLGYKLGYELLMLNGLITFSGLYIFSQKNNAKICA